MGKQADKALTPAVSGFPLMAAGSWGGRIVQLFDYVFILRPTLFFPVWIVFGAGYFTFQPRGVEMALGEHDTIAGLWLVGALLTLLMGSAYILNQIIDIPIDRENNKLFLIADGHVPLRHAYIEMVVVALVALAGAFLVRLELGMLFVVIFLVTGILYSVPPFVWKDRPLAGLAANFLGAELIYVCGAWAGGAVEIRPFFYAIPCALAVAAVYLLTTIQDRKGDAVHRKMTFAVKYGIAATAAMAAVLEFMALGFAWLWHDPIMFYPALLSAPFFLIAAWKRDERAAVRAIKFPILLLALTVSLYWVSLLLLLGITYYLAKMYYYMRFGLRYPSLNPE